MRRDFSNEAPLYRSSLVGRRIADGEGDKYGVFA